MRKILTLDHKIARLRHNDPILGTIIAQRKISPPKKQSNHFRALVMSIVSQQLSGKAADTILKRFIALFPGKRFPTPEDVLKMSTSKMRKSGLSKMKVSFLKDLSRTIVKKKINLKTLQKLSNEEIIEQLVLMKGIGQWTAEMFLIFSLNRDDVFSYGDLGLRNAIRNIYKLKAHPTKIQAEKISSKWKPYRSIACRYLWASLDNR